MCVNITAKKILKSGRGAFICSLAVAIAATGMGAVYAQDEPAETADQLNLPSTITMLGEKDPNVRTATAVVNGFVITGTDIDQRVALVLNANDSQVSDEELVRLRQQVLRNLIDETLQIQEARALEIEVSRDEIDETYLRVATQNFGQNVAEMSEYLTKIGSSAASLKRQIEGEMAWQRLLQRNVQPFVNVSEEEVNELLERLKASKGTEEYRLGEIYLAATPESEAAVFQNGQQIMDQLQQGGSFVAYARQYSQASTATVGGDLGWVRLPQLPTELSTVVRDLQAGQLVGPVKIPGGFSILLLIDKRQVLTADPRDAVLSLKQISMTFDPNMREADAQAKLAVFTREVQTIRGCGDADGVAASIGADVVANDQIRARALPAALQDALLQLAVGQATPPFGSLDEGVRVLMLCGRDDPEVDDGPSFDELMNQLESDRVNKRAQRYLRDLRRDAIIEYN